MKSAKEDGDAFARDEEIVGYVGGVPVSRPRGLPIRGAAMEVWAGHSETKASSPTQDESIAERLDEDDNFDEQRSPAHGVDVEGLQAAWSTFHRAVQRKVFDAVYEAAEWETLCVEMNRYLRPSPGWWREVIDAAISTIRH